jgi:cytochrome c556
MKLIKYIGIIFLVSSSSLVIAEAPEKSAIQKLSPELRVLLQKEMQALQKAMNQVFNAYISGKTSEVSNIAEQMKNSYILMQNLTDEQKHELHQLPDSFLEADQKFHEYAEMLEHVAFNKNKDMIGFYYYKLAESCMSCHSKHALHRFPDLKSVKQVSHEH